MEALNNKMRERALADARWRQIQHDLDQSVGEIYDSYDDLSKFVNMTLSLVYIFVLFFIFIFIVVSQMLIILLLWMDIFQWVWNLWKYTVKKLMLLELDILRE